MSCEGRDVIVEGFNCPHRTCIIILPRQDVKIKILYGISNFSRTSSLKKQKEKYCSGFYFEWYTELSSESVRKSLCNSCLNTVGSTKLCHLKGTSGSYLVQPAAQSSGNFGWLLRIFYILLAQDVGDRD